MIIKWLPPVCWRQILVFDNLTIWHLLLLLASHQIPNTDHQWLAMSFHGSHHRHIDIALEDLFGPKCFCCPGPFLNTISRDSFSGEIYITVGGKRMVPRWDRDIFHNLVLLWNFQQILSPHNDACSPSKAWSNPKATFVNETHEHIMHTQKLFLMMITNRLPSCAIHIENVPRSDISSAVHCSESSYLRFAWWAHCGRSQNGFNLSKEAKKWWQGKPVKITFAHRGNKAMLETRESWAFKL